jgi:hypothetical protein
MVDLFRAERDRRIDARRTPGGIAHPASTTNINTPATPIATLGSFGFTSNSIVSSKRVPASAPAMPGCPAWSYTARAAIGYGAGLGNLRK